MKFYDIETEEVITLAELEEEFNRLKAEHETETENFSDYIINCTSKNGTLEIIE